MFDGLHSRLDDALLSVDQTLGVLLEPIQDILKVLFERSIRAAEDAHAIDHLLGGFHDPFDVLYLLLLHPGAVDEAQEGNERLLGGDEYVVLQFHLLHKHSLFCIFAE